MHTRVHFATTIALAALAAPLAHAAQNPAPAPAVFGYDTAVLASTRQRVAAQDPAIMPAFQAFIREAGKLLAMKPESVMDKEKTADSGDKHDYYSLAPYHWPDPDKKDGKPYIRKDGQLNPDSKKGTDANAFPRVCSAVETLGLAYYFTGDETYAQKAAQLAIVWFLDPKTYMKPSFNYAQAIPGQNSGRNAGVLEARHLANLSDGLALIAASPAWPANAQAAMRKWLEAYYAWVTTSPFGLKEAAAPNNHGTWCNAHIAHIELALGKTAPARARIKRELTSRIASQITPAGGQPQELARTRSYHYSLYNLEALFALAQLGDHADYSEGWAYKTRSGSSLRAALAYVAPYLDPSKTWPHKDIEPGGINRARACDLLRVYLAHQADPELKALWEKYSPGYAQKNSRQLLFLPPVK